jgi:hypothetical protein
MQLDLSDDDVELLREALDSAMDRLTSEIRRTDNRIYRQNLKGRRDQLRSLIDVLGGQPESVTARPSVAGEPASE